MEQTPQEQPQGQQAFSVPESYQEKGWAKDLKSVDDLWKLTDNAQSLIGKRPAGIPEASAPDEEWQKFYAAAGRPESPDKYQFPDVEGLPEGADISRQKETAMKLFHEAGVTQKQAEKLWKSYIGSEMGAANEMKTAWEAKQKELDAEFDTVTKEIFGDKYDAKAKQALDLINQYAPEKLKPSMSALGDNPQAMAGVIAVLDGVKADMDKLRAEYGAEGKLTSGTQSPSRDIVEIRTELANLRISQAARDFQHPDHAKTLQQIASLSEEVNRHYK